MSKSLVVQTRAALWICQASPLKHKYVVARLNYNFFFLKILLQPQRLDYSERIAKYVHSSNEIFCLLRFAVLSHMWRWQHCQAYSLLASFFPSFFPLSFSVLAFLHYPIPLPLSSLLLATDPQRQSALFCLSTIVHQHKNTNDRQLKAINSFEVDPLFAWHQPPWLLSQKTSRSIAATTSPPPQKAGITLKAPFSKMLQQSSTAVWNQSFIKSWNLPSELCQSVMLWIELLEEGLFVLHCIK